MKLARCDPTSGLLLRDPATGLCAECSPGEAGQVLGLIDDADPSRRFDGYTDSQATAKKVRLLPPPHPFALTSIDVQNKLL